MTHPVASQPRTASSGSIDPRLLLRIAFIAIIIAGILVITKMATMAFDSTKAGRRMDREVERATTGNRSPVLPPSDKTDSKAAPQR